MARPPPIVQHGASAHAQLNAARPAKRVKYESVLEGLPGGKEDAPAVPSHPLGVRPSGNAYTTATNVRGNAGFFAVLPDELLLQLLECLDARNLLGIGATCRALHAFSRADELWKALLIE